ncbi:dCMP deaminase, partial [Cryptosporidium tyzzeri]
MIIVGLIRLDNVVAEYAFRFIVERFRFKRIRLVDCERNCNFYNAANKLKSTNKLESHFKTFGEECGEK